MENKAPRQHNDMPKEGLGNRIKSAASTIGRAIVWLLKECGLALIAFYQHCISPWLGANCRFSPTCSEYARQAFVKYGPFKGAWLALRRILRCHPFHKGGYDPLP